MPTVPKVFTALALIGCLAGGAAIESRLPNGRLITPQGGWLSLAPYPFALSVRPDNRQLAIPSIGYPFSINIVDDPGLDDSGASASRLTRLPDSRKTKSDMEVHAGVTYAPDGRLLYDATGDSGAVDVLSTATWKRVARYSLNGPLAGTNFKESFAAALALSPDGRTLYALDQGNWRVVALDAATGRRIASFSTGSNPFTLAIAPDGKRLYIANSGLFEYQLIEGADEKDLVHTGLHFPPFGFPSKAARRGVRVEEKNVPGLGDENSTRGSSLWTYDIATPSQPALIAKLRLGAKIETKPKGVIGGASPSGIVADGQHVYVTLSHDDVIAVLDPTGKTLQREIALTPFTGVQYQDSSKRPLRGIMPFGLAQDADHLYVAEAGINAVAVISKLENKVLGHLPVGWYPAAVALSPSGKTLYAVNNKGKGAGPNGGEASSRDAGRYIGELEFGSLSSIALPFSNADLQSATAAVLRNNRAALDTAAAPSDQTLPRLKHTFLIIRENRTFDECLGDLPGVNGDPKLARFGMHGWTSETPDPKDARGGPPLKDLRVTPNAHALAARFAVSDNFYTDSDVSADGHRWAVGAAPTPWMNLAWTSGYGGRRRSSPFSLLPGRRALGGGADSPMPEDEPEFGSLWEHLAGAGVALRNYGEGLELEGGMEQDEMEPEGQRLVLNAPVPQPVFVSTDKSFPTFNLGIPDQLRFNEFSKDFGPLLAHGKAPGLTVIRLPNDHMTRPRPTDGYPYRESYVADNDLALGKIVEWISHSSVWSDSAIFVFEDDAQGGVDHVDAHRSPLLVISPRVKRGFISHRHLSMPSVQKTIYELLGQGSLNLEDALAADLAGMFTATPDLAPFTAQPADPRLFDPAKARIAHPKNATQARELLECDNPRTIQAEFHHKPNRKGRPVKDDD